MKTFKDYLAEEEYDRQRDADAVSGKPRKTSVGGGKKPKGYSKDKAEKAAVDNVKKALAKNEETDYEAKKKALQDIQMDPNTSKDPELKKELARRKAELEKTKEASETNEGGMSDVMIGVDELISDFTNQGDKESGLKMPKAEVIQSIKDSGADPMEIRFAIDTINSEFDMDGNYKYAGYDETIRMKELAGISLDEETYDGDDFYNAYGDLWFNEDEVVDEAEYQGRKVKLGKPMRGDVKKFKVYVKNPKGNIVKVNFGDPDMKIKKSNPARRRSFRARHNCDNPGPRHKARYWSCRKW